MAITIKGIRIKDIHIEQDIEGGSFKINTAQYSLIGSTGKVLANQVIGGYNGLVMEMSPQTKKALETFANFYVADAQALLGLLE